MTLKNQLRWGGWWIIAAAVLVGGMNMLVYSNRHNAAIQAAYGVGFTGLILTSTMIHVAQARRSGMFGLLAYLITALSLVFANVVTFLTLAEMAGIQEVHQVFTGIWNPVMRIAVYGCFIGWALLGASVALTGVLPRWAGILVAVGISLQLPAQYALEIAGPLFFLFTIGGSALFAAGLIWIGWALWSGKGWTDEAAGLSNLDRRWGAPLIMLAAALTVVNAYLNSVADLTLADGVVNLLSVTTVIFAIVILHTAQADRAGGIGLAGFFFTHLGSTLIFITAYLIMAQLAGQIETNRALMASWVDIPVGRFGSYMLLLGMILFGVSVIRAEVFPRWSGWLVAIGLALLLPSQLQSQDYLFAIFWVIGAALQGIGLGRMGWSLFKKNPLVE